MVRGKNADGADASEREKRIGNLRVAYPITLRMKPTHISVLHIPQNVLNETLKYLRAHGNEGKECIVFWSGRLLSQNKGCITFCIYPNQQASAIGAEVNLLESAKIHLLLYKRQEFLFAQVHTHPGEAFHSFTDNYYPLTDKPGFFSIVVPYYCATGLKNLSKCAVYEYKGEGAWRKLDKKEIKKRFKVVRQINE